MQVLCRRGLGCSADVGWGAPQMWIQVLCTCGLGCSADVDWGALQTSMIPLRTDTTLTNSSLATCGSVFLAVRKHLKLIHNGTGLF